MASGAEISCNINICFTSTALHQATADASFSAYAYEGYQYPSAGEAILFPLVMTNTGGHYDSTASVYRCPVNGTYMFTFSLYSTNLYGLGITSGVIQIGETRLSEAYCSNYGNDIIRVQCGNTAVVGCRQGEEVSITAPVSASHLYGLDKRSTFSGFLISAEA